MQAVILAGGLGNRLRPLTDKIPKAMTIINGEPFLRHLIVLLKGQGISDIVLCIGYLGEQIKDYFGDGSSLKIKIAYNEEGEKLLGTGGALKKAQNLLDEQFLVINGDTYLPIDYPEVVYTFTKSGRDALIVVYDNRDYTSVISNVQLDNDKLVSAYDKENAGNTLSYVDAGVIILKRKVLDMIQVDTPISLEEGFYQPLIKQREVAAFITGQRFYDIGTPERKAVFETFLERNAE